MPTELMKDFIDKVCSITLLNELSGSITGRIAAAISLVRSPFDSCISLPPMIK